MKIENHFLSGLQVTWIFTFKLHESKETRLAFLKILRHDDMFTFNVEDGENNTETHTHNHYDML
jgi:hypothetical protein